MGRQVQIPAMKPIGKELASSGVESLRQRAGCQNIGRCVQAMLHERSSKLIRVITVELASISNRVSGLATERGEPRGPSWIDQRATEHIEVLAAQLK
jgi:hypothetical protein